ncbi:MAG: hypothetical protein JWP63_6129 [Candidatus Solibacter sp.]|jgi:uncharacterized FlaG/YvyC family protein|nr:hypothetical protein [Candidatus Solibacter sp.]
MDITAVNRGEVGLHAPAPVAPAEKTAEHRLVVQAVKAVNGTEMFGSENELRFQKDPHSNRMVVKVVNRKTSEVLSQMPSEYVLRLAEEVRKT